MFGHLTCQDPLSVPRSGMLAKTTTAVAGVHRRRPPRTDTTTGAPSRGSIAVIRPSRRARAGMPSASIAHIAYTAGKPSSSTCWRVGVADNG